MRSRGILMLFIAAIAGLAAVLLAARWMQTQGGDRGRIAVANVDIELGGRISPEMVRLADWPDGSVPTGAFNDASKLEGRVVLVGRGAQALLAQRADALHVFIVASKPWRMKLAVDRLGADPASVEKLIDDTDRQRDQYVKTYYTRTRHDPANYDMVLNAERLGFEGAAGLVVQEARRRGWS